MPTKSEDYVNLCFELTDAYEKLTEVTSRLRPDRVKVMEAAYQLGPLIRRMIGYDKLPPPDEDNDWSRRLNP